MELWDRAGYQSPWTGDTAEVEGGPQQSLEKCHPFPVSCLRGCWSFSPRWTLIVLPVSLWNLPPHGQRMSQESSSTELWERVSPSLLETWPPSAVWEVEPHLLLLSLQALLEKEHEQIALPEVPSQTQGELFPAQEQEEQLRQQVEELQENGQVSLAHQVTVKGRNKSIKQSSWG